MGEIIKFFLNTMRALNPRIADTPEQIFAWRQTVAVSLVLLTFVTFFNLGHDYGWLEPIGISGHVSTDQFNDIQRLVRQTRQDQLVQQILDNTRRYCLAYDAGDQGGMQFAFQALQENRAAYFQLTSREYPQLMCSMSAQPAKPARANIPIQQ